MPLAERGAPRVLVDLRGAPRIDSVASGCSCSRSGSCRWRRARVQVSNHEVLRTLEVTGLDRFFESKR